MYVNKCVKCGREFETKNPKRVICPDCLYPDKKMMITPSQPESTPKAEGGLNQPEQQTFDFGGTASANTQSAQSSHDAQPKFYSSYSAGEDRPRPQQRSYSTGGYNQQNNRYRRDNSYPQRRDGYGRTPQNNRYGGYQKRDNQGGRPQNNRGFNRNNNRRPGGFAPRNSFNGRKPMNRSKAPKQLLVSKEQLEQIELLYKTMLPLPNPDAHEVIGEKIGLEPRKVFFGINLVRQKMMLPKLPFPKRKLAITPDQLFAIKNLYEPLLPLPPIGCHKIIAAQLKMDEWRVHVGIGLIRTQMGLQRWNQEREDAPEEFKKSQIQQPEETSAELTPTEEQIEVAEKPKRGRPKKVVSEDSPE